MNEEKKELMVVNMRARARKRVKANKMLVRQVSEKR